VDYAHTPDGLETVLRALRPHVRGKLIVVFGAGGDRDRTKRPLMGRIAAELADVAIVTDDNPRGEVPAAIRAEILAAAAGAREVGDRREAIRTGAALMDEGDILVVAGKGHEQGQIVGDVVHPFDDVAETASALHG
jgi:UDP-N-acetylmuramoyl-L-alanyl-D-glutamate--2,6-diaminopimelate ligase